MGKARDEFQLAIDLASDPEVAPDAPLVEDLRTLASDFMRLLAADSAGIGSTPLPVVVLTEPPLLRTIYSSDDHEVVPPVVKVQQFPPWPSWLSSASDGRKTSVLEVVVDENGRVESAMVRPPLHPVYDGMLLEATRSWRYEPALRGSRPVKYRRLIEILAPGRRQAG
ncbi:MAG: hypothetical protein EHM24_27985 [Acidobacteria bacterium]|nr:MAG: hypothetical protein EHM24_27985 [Acidobacteriota bacterium]